jgi:hypothetical protein
MHAVFNVRVRKPVEFVRKALKHFHRDCFLSLEGDLSRFDFALVPGASREPSDLLRRNTITLNAGIVRLLAIGNHRTGLPEPEP